MIFRRFFTQQFDPQESSDLKGWRLRALDGVLRGIFAFWLLGLAVGIHNVLNEYFQTTRNDKDLWLAVGTISVYAGVTLLISLITFNRKIKYSLRAGILLFVVYVLGVVGMALSSFSGDGRIFFFALVILAAIFFDIRYSLVSFGAVFLTIIFLGYLQVSGIAVVPAARQVNAALPGAWLSGGIILLVFSIAAVISITYLLRAFDKSLDDSHKLLDREQNLALNLRVLSDINQLIVREQDRGKLLANACERLVEAHGFTSVWVGLLSSDELSIHLAASAGGEVDASVFPIRVYGESPVQSCVARALESKSYVYVEAFQNADSCLTCPRQDLCPTRSALALPLIREDKRLGVMVLEHERFHDAFSEENFKPFQELADDLAYALEKLEADSNLKTYARYQALLNDVTQTAIEIPDVNTMARTFITKLESTLGADAYYFTLWNEEKQIVENVIYSEGLRDVFSNPIEVQPGERTFSRSILEQEQVLVVEDMMNTPYASPRIAALFGVCSALGMPLISDGRKIGVLVMGYREAHAFSQEEVSLAEQAARHFALALSKAKLNDETRSKAAELEILYSAAKDMASSLMDPPTLLYTIASHMAKALNVTSANIVSANSTENSMTVVAEYWSDEASQAERQSDLGRDFPNSDYATVIDTIMQGEVMILHEGDPRLTTAEREQFHTYQIKTMMFVPIMSRGQLLGSIELWESRYQHDFTLSEIRLAQAMTSYAAAIIENSTLFAQTREQESELRALLKVSRAVSSSLQLSDVLKQAASTLARLMRVDFCSLSDYFPDRNEIVTIALYSADADVSGMDGLGHVFSLDDYPATRQVLQTGQPFVTRLDDPNSDPSEVRQLRHDEMCSSLLIPLRLREQSLGLAELFTSDPKRVFQPHEVQFASALADQVAVAIDNARLYEKLEDRETYFRALIENFSEGVAIVDAQGIFQYMSPTEERLTGYTPDERIGRSALEHIDPNDMESGLVAFSEIVANPDAIQTIQYRLQRKDGIWRSFEAIVRNMLDNPHIGGLVVNYRDITSRKEAGDALKDSEERYRTIFETAGVPIWEDDYSPLMDAIDKLRRQGITDFACYLNEHPEFLDHVEKLIKITDVNQAVVQMMEAKDKSEVMGALGDVLNNNRSEQFVQDIISLAEGRTHIEHEATLYTLRGNRRDVWVSLNIVPIGFAYKRVLVSTLDITERKQAERALQENQSRLAGIIDTAPNGIITIDASQKIVLFNPFAESIFGCSAEYAIGKTIDIFIPERHRYSHSDNVNNFGKTHVSSRRHGRLENLNGLRMNGEEFPMEAFISQYTLGEERFFTVIVRDITDRKRDEESLRRRAEELQSLVIVSSALRSALNVSEIIPLVVRYAVEIVGGAFGTIYQLEEATGNLVSPGWFSVERGEDIKMTSDISLRHVDGLGFTGYVAKTGQIHITEDIHSDPLANILPGEEDILKGAQSGISLPLLSQEKVVGVLHVRLRKRHVFSETEIRLLTAIAEMAGSAIHRAVLHEKTLRQADELARAYDNTLVGWARALELRDELTEGHTRRVTELTIELARALNIPEAEITHIRRGAILHDIGKMGIPDSILHKAGPLTAHELRIMQMHPQYAYEMLSIIPFLHPSLDIPYCHHEHWDGNGYPRGLKGEAIPLSARIFSVVDVWDALTSDRPYRSAWSKEKARDYIFERSGKQFDPHIVEKFLPFIDGLSIT